jgi:hypothetical protein
MRENSRQGRNDRGRDRDRGRNGGGRVERREAKPRFEYHRRDPEEIKQQIERSRSRFDNPYKGIMFRAKQGDNLVRILPPTWDNHKHYSYQVFMHRYVGPDESHYLCRRKMLNKPCAICDAERDARDHGDIDEAKKLAPRERWVCYILDREGEDPTKPLLWDMNGYQDQDIVTLTHNKRSAAVVYVDHPDEGRDLSFRRSGQMDRTRYSAFQFDSDPCPIADSQKTADAILDEIYDHPIPDILNFFENDYLEEMLGGTREASDQDLDRDAGEPPPRRRSSDRDADATRDDDEATTDDDQDQDNDEQTDDEQPDDDEEDKQVADEGEPDVRPPRRPLQDRSERERTQARGNGGDRDRDRPAPRPASRPRPPAGRDVRRQSRYKD